MGILEEARAGRITEEMETVCREEGVSPEFVRRGLVSGRIVIPVSPYRKTMPVGIGKGLRTKINASIGTSSDIVDVEMEVAKAREAEAAGADTLMELSTGGDFAEIRRRVIEATSLSVGSVPLYQAFIEAIRKHGAGVEMTEDDLFRATEQQARLGTNFMAIHTGINRLCLDRLQGQGGRFGGICSRGGAFMIAWMIYNNKENPLFKDFDYLVEILKEHEVTLSMGNGLRAGAICDSTDRAQIQELIINSELADRASRAGLQVIVEGPGHIPIDEIEANVRIMKRMSEERPFYMLGPLVTDIAPGYDHIVAAVGASLSSAYGADFICYVTPAEHLALPNVEDVRQGVITARIAAHIGDMIKNNDRGADLEMGRARRDMNWDRQFDLALDPDAARVIRQKRAPANSRVCTMCGDYCALKIIDENVGLKR
ncbi:MAG: thiamine biosynthesis protein ThiC [Methanosaeta sp. PtaU1.Bin028]|nr:MAG: thiamine biosynthesis protein ThiC [Methanosaeta sp. PtaU1.Bin028]